MFALLALVSACRDGVAPDRRVAPANAHRDVSAPVILETFYGPESFVRGRGAPDSFQRIISTVGFEAPFVLHVRNGDASGANRTSSATVTFDGTTVVGESAFQQTAAGWDIAVNPATSATLGVRMASAPGSVVQVWLEGKRSAALFCPDGRPGAFVKMRDAILAAPAGGTVAICDGVWDIDTVRVDKPLTIRSQNPHGATLRDSDPQVTGVQTGRPALLIDGVTSGLVRIADVTFAPRGRAISATVAYDQVVIDSCRFPGRNANSAIGLEVFPNSVAGARVEVKNSDFDHVSIGVFVVGAVETSVHDSHFDSLMGGAATFSGSGTEMAFGEAVDNVVANCVNAGCIRVRASDPRGILIARNHIDGPAANISPAGAIDVTPQSGSQGTVTVEDNAIVSHRITSQPANVAAGWSFQSGIRVTQVGTTNIVRRNTVADAFEGLEVSAPVDAEDNTVTGGTFAFKQSGLVAAVIRRNDFTGQTASFTAPFSSGNYQCNYWGSSFGPINPPPNTTTYAPWVTQPIANTTAVCDPTAPITAVRVCATPSTTVMTVPTVLQGYNLVSAGGTVTICPGTYLVSSVVGVTKAVSFVGEDPMPTIDAGTGPRAFGVNSVPSGVVRFSNLRFTGSTSQLINVAIGAGNVEIRNSEFRPNQTSPYGVLPKGAISGIVLNGTGINATIDHNQFIGGDMGVSTAGTPGAQVAITNNVFTGQSNISISQSTVTDAGSWLIANNAFSDCADSNCIFAPRPSTITGNTFAVRIDRPMAVVVQAGFETVPPGAFTITDNTITGTGNNATSRSLGATYPVHDFAIIVVNATADVSRNHITNAFQGIGALTGATVTASDNTIQTTFAPFGAGSTPANTHIANWNDLSDYISAVGNPGQVNTSASNLRCNWWGQVTGPVGMPGAIPTSVYTPFATAPVAGQPHTGCTP